MTLRKRRFLVDRHLKTIAWNYSFFLGPYLGNVSLYVGAYPENSSSNPHLEFHRMGYLMNFTRYLSRQSLCRKDLFLDKIKDLCMNKITQNKDGT
ncbi:hypothetical protein CDL12_23475 [Handroanthus impetiginosus]|uniref:Uncharacterized protein n=1 Tax=Handroanthus impetiginosus TaxID=429701 RepID=A0A2G9GG52_9LAMI|nr:hypothetical protein CDL12_23475 [Handroanthus impetiginosus]